MAVERWSPFGIGLERWDPFRSLSDIQHEVNRLFDNFYGRPGAVATGERTWAPLVDMYETKDDLVVALEVPGVREKEINVSLTGDLLTVRGERHFEQERAQDTYHHMERLYGKLERTLQLPMPVQGDKVKATYRDGILEIRLPKVEEIKPREIKVAVL